jgi:hypothetical protein
VSALTKLHCASVLARITLVSASSSHMSSSRFGLLVTLRDNTRNCRD